MNFKVLFLFFLLLFPHIVKSQQLTYVGNGWANNSVNTTIFRKNSIVSLGDTQFIAYYDNEGYLILGKRKITDKEWTLTKSQYQGNVRDAHNVISIMIDGDGYLHVSWDQHGHPLRYVRSIEPFSLELGNKESMTGNIEGNITYPEFFRMPNGNLIFMYRDGESGRGNLVLNRYDIKTRKWTQIQKDLIDGENARNAYWQACIDKNGVIHLSWVWRETWDVSTNHDLCYARSLDGGETWEDSKGNKYKSAITLSTAEYACYISQENELINQTSMTTDEQGNPYIATYWRGEGTDIPQYHVVYNKDGKWNSLNLGFRKTPFTLKGGGTKRIPISRPQIISKNKDGITSLYLIFRDEERDSKVSVAICKDITKNNWKIADLTDFSVNSWEPSYDTELWMNKELLHIFVQKTEQIDGEGKANIPPQPVYVLELNNPLITMID